jgi:hypothetical protein
MALLAGLCLLGAARLAAAQNITFDYNDIASIPGCNNGDSSQLTPGVPDCVLKNSLGEPRPARCAGVASR